MHDLRPKLGAANLDHHLLVVPGDESCEHRVELDYSFSSFPALVEAVLTPEDVAHIRLAG
jgi:hypothetical protein